MQEKSQDNDYWRDRFRQMEEAQNRASIEQAQLMAEQYERAERKIAGKINAWYQRFANNNEISMAEAKRLLNSGELKELRWDVQEYIRYGEENAISQAWAKELENASARIHIRRLEALNLQVQQEIEALYGNCIDSIDNHIRKTYSRDFYHTAFEIHRGIGVGSRLTGLDERLLDKIVSKPWAIDGKNFSERLWGNKTRLVNELHNSLSTMCITGQSPQRVIDDFCNKMKSSRKNTTRLIMTESAVFANQARKDCMKELEVEEYEVIETLDGITCEFCQKMDKKHFKLSDFRVGVTAPVFHPNCRGCTCPYFNDEFTRMEERAARRWDGKVYDVPADMSYKDWERTFVEGEKSDFDVFNRDSTARGTRKAKINKNNFTYITNEWINSKGTKGTIAEMQEYIVNGVKYKVDGKHVILRPTERERKVAGILSEKYGKTVEFVPQILFPQGIQTPDYLINGNRFDLKSPTGIGKNLIYGLLSKKRRQSDNFVVDISDCPLSEEEIEGQIESLYTSPRTGFVQKIVLMKGAEVLKVYGRK